MLLMKSCPRCSGDLLTTRNARADDPDVSCVQCGYAGYSSVIRIADALEEPSEGRVRLVGSGACANRRTAETLPLRSGRRGQTSSTEWRAA